MTLKWLKNILNIVVIRQKKEDLLIFLEHFSTTNVNGFRLLTFEPCVRF